MLEDNRKFILASVATRQGQSEFRRLLITAYEGKCAVTGCNVEIVLEAAHILPYKGEQTNRVNNGILLRADLHTLFDANLLTIDPETKKVCISIELHTSTYGQFHGTSLRLPQNPSDHPSQSALKARTNLLSKTSLEIDS